MDTFLPFYDYYMTSETNLGKIESYLTIESVGGAEWSPNGDKITFISDKQGHFDIYEIDVQDSTPSVPTLIVHADDRSTCPRYLSDHTLLFLQDRGGDENFQPMLRDEAGNIHSLSIDSNAKYNLAVQTNHYVYFSANLEDKATFTLYRQRIPLLSHQPEKLYHPEKGYFNIEAVSPDDSYVIFSEFISIEHINLFALQISTGKVHHLSRLVEQKEKVPSAHWTAFDFIDPTTLLVGTNHRSEFLQLGLLTISGEYIPLLDQDPRFEHDISQVIWNDQAKQIIFTINDEGYTRLFQAALRNHQLNSIEAIELPLKGRIGAGDSRSFTTALSFSPSKDRITMTLASPNRPPNLWLLDFSSKQWKKLVEIDLRGLEMAQFVDAQLHHFTSSDNLQIPYFEYLPKIEAPRQGFPCIIIIHGGPESQTTAGFGNLIQFYVSAGFAVVLPNIRGSTGYGKTYERLDNIEKRLDAIRDIAELAHRLKNHSKDIDGDRLVIYGGSYGGFATLSAITEYPSLWKAAVDLYGVSNYVTFLQNTAAWRRELREVEYGYLKRDRKVLERISPINYIDQIQCPLFLVGGDNDERVPITETLQIYQQLKDKIPVELMHFADEGHGITKFSNRLQLYPAILNWLKKFV